jgi:hypothetical protein
MPVCGSDYFLAGARVSNEHDFDSRRPHAQVEHLDERAPRGWPGSAPYVPLAPPAHSRTVAQLGGEGAGMLAVPFVTVGAPQSAVATPGNPTPAAVPIFSPCASYCVVTAVPGVRLSKLTVVSAADAFPAASRHAAKPAPPARTRRRVPTS